MKSLKDIFSSKKRKPKKLGTVRNDFYRGYLIKRNSDDSGHWSVVLGEHIAVGEVKYIKMAIDHWAEYKLYASPGHFKNQDLDETHRQVFDYKNFKLINDLGGKNDWYISYRGRLMKGSKEKIIAAIDYVELKAEEKRSASAKSE